MVKVDCYRECDFFNEIITWWPLLRFSKILEAHYGECLVHYMYEEALSPELECITKVLSNKIETVW